MRVLHMAVCALGLSGALASAQDDLPRTNLVDELAAYWRFDGSLAETLADRHGLAKGGRPIKYVAGKFGQAIRLNGLDQFIELPRTETLLKIKYKGSLAFWFKVEGRAGTLLWKGVDSWAVEYEPPGLLFGFAYNARRAAERVFVDSDRVESQQWHHFVVATDWDDDTTRLYVDGRMVSDTSVFRSISRYPMVIGGHPLREGNLFQGSMDELAIWANRVLTPDEVARLWNGGEGLAIESLLEDTDGDGIPDLWERRRHLRVDQDDGMEDLDEDGIVNLDEYRLGLDPWEKDSDGDGFSDDVETNTGVWDDVGSGTDPLWFDTDLDGLPDGLENPLGPERDEPTDPNVWDSDGDGFGDGDETTRGTDPSDPEVKPDLSQGLKAYWRFDGDLTDSHGGNDGTYGASGEAVYETGPLGKGILLDGNHFVDINASPGEFGFLEGGFTVSCWLRMDGHDSVNTILEQGAGRSWFLDASIPQGLFIVVPRGEEVTKSLRPNPKEFVDYPINGQDFVHVVGVSHVTKVLPIDRVGLRSRGGRVPLDRWWVRVPPRQSAKSVREWCTNGREGERESPQTSQEGKRFENRELARLGVV